MSCYERIRQVNARTLGVEANNATTRRGSGILSISTHRASALIGLISRGQNIRMYWPNSYMTTDHYSVSQKKGYTNVRANNLTKNKNRLIIFLELNRLFSWIWFVKLSDNYDANLFCYAELKCARSGTVFTDLCNQPSMLHDCIRNVLKTQSTPYAWAHFVKSTINNSIKYCICF